MRSIDPPRTAAQTGVPRRVLEELTLKTAYLLGEASLHDLAEHLRIVLPIVDDLFQQLRKEQLCHVTGLSRHVLFDGPAASTLTPDRVLALFSSRARRDEKEVA